jgi:hypothetical protein
MEDRQGTAFHPTEAPDAPPALVTSIVRRWLPLILLGSMFALMVRRAAQQLTNGDTYFHLRFGHEFIGGWSVRDPGSVSSFATADWEPTQWLGQVSMAWVEDAFGLGGVAALSGVLNCLVGLSIYVLTRRWADLLPAAVVTIVTLAACLPTLTMRPQVVSILFIAVTTHLWMTASTHPRRVWALVPLTWLWSMIHGMWPVAIAIGVVACAALLLDSEQDPRPPRNLVAVPLLSVVAAALTPLLWRIYGAVWSVGPRREFFAEWQPPDFTDPSNAVVAAMLAMTVLLVARGASDSKVPIFLTVLAMGFALYSLRTVPVAALLLAPVLARHLQEFVGPRQRRDRSERLAVLGMVATAMLAVILIAPRTASEPPSQPCVDRHLSTLPEGTPILNDWAWGGYLMWRFPQLDPVMHGYGDTFTITELRRNDQLLLVEPGWDSAVDALGVSVALLPADSSLAYALERQMGWQATSCSDDVLILQGPDSA